MPASLPYASAHADEDLNAMAKRLRYEHAANQHVIRPGAKVFLKHTGRHYHYVYSAEEGHTHRLLGAAVSVAAAKKWAKENGWIIVKNTQKG